MKIAVLNYRRKCADILDVNDEVFDTMDIDELLYDKLGYGSNNTDYVVIDKLNNIIIEIQNGEIVEARR